MNTPRHRLPLARMTCSCSTRRGRSPRLKTTLRRSATTARDPRRPCPGARQGRGRGCTSSQRGRVSMPSKPTVLGACVAPAQSSLARTQDTGIHPQGVLAEGGMGGGFEAMRPWDGLRCALKVLRPERRSSARDAAWVVAAPRRAVAFRPAVPGRRHRRPAHRARHVAPWRCRWGRGRSTPTWRSS